MKGIAHCDELEKRGRIYHRMPVSAPPAVLAICIVYRKTQRAVYKLSMGTCKQLVGLDEGGLGVYQCSVGLFDAFRKVFSQLTIEEFHATLLCVADAANNVCLQADDLLDGRLNFRR